MALIVIHATPEYGHVIPTLALASLLQAKGHEIRFVGESDLSAILRKNKWPLTPLFSKSRPRGFQDFLSTLNVADRTRALDAVSQKMFMDYVSGNVERTFKKLKPDLLLIDGLRPLSAVLAYKLKIPFVVYWHSVPLYYEHGQPPLNSVLLPARVPRDYAAIDEAWQNVLAAERQYEGLTGNPDLFAVDQFALRCGFSLDNLEQRSLIIPFAIRSVPEIVLLPAAFDFPRTVNSRRVYWAPFVEQVSRSKQLPVRQRSPLVFCSFGSQSKRHDNAREIFQAVINAIARRPSWRGVIAVGSKERMRQLRNPCPSRIQLAEWVPYEEVLPKASVFFTHCGMGAINHAIRYGVPMVACPLGYDQPGNSARIAYHRIGIPISAEKLTTRTITRCIDEILQNSDYRSNIRRMRKSAFAPQKTTQLYRFILALLRR